MSGTKELSTSISPRERVQATAEEDVQLKSPWLAIYKDPSGIEHAILAILLHGVYRTVKFL
jgi:hypothetical protein